MPAANSLSTTVLTGFLGSGKTTLLRRALASPSLSDTAVIINEIGEIAIDHHLVDFVEGGVLELPGGCLCCAMREDLAQTLRSLLARRDAGEIGGFRRIVIETSGLADPAPILYTLGADPVLDRHLQLGRVVTVVDAENGAGTLARFAEATSQAAVADALVVSKTDRVPVSPELTARLDAINPDAERILGAGVADAGALLFAARRAPSPAGGGGLGCGPAAEAAHTHGIEAFTLIFGGAMTRLDFAKALGELAARHGPDLLRVKGIVGFADRPGGPAVVQAAQHAMFAPEWLADWPDGDRRSRLVFVVHDIPLSEILGHFAKASPAVLGGHATHAVHA